MFGVNERMRFLEGMIILNAIDFFGLLFLADSLETVTDRLRLIPTIVRVQVSKKYLRYFRMIFLRITQ